MLLLRTNALDNPTDGLHDGPVAAVSPSHRHLVGCMYGVVPFSMLSRRTSCRLNASDALSHG
jgi:hypothetical protein